MGVVDIYVAYKFVKILTQPWKETDAYKLGIIDEKGKILKKRKNLKTGEEKAAYTIFHTLIWNVKKLLDKLPPTRTRLGSFAVALWLLKEYADPRIEDKQLLERTLVEYLVETGRVSREEAMNHYFEAMLTEEERELSPGDKAEFEPLETSILRKGRFKLLNSVDAPGGSGRKGNIVQARSDTEAFDSLLGQPMFRVKLEKNLKDLVVSFEDLERITG